MNESQSVEPERRPGPLHQRPRLGGDGRLWLPVTVRVDHDGTVRIPRFSRTVDPFDPSADELLLAESFARLALGDHRALQGWFLYHGALDRAGFWDETRRASTAQADHRAVDPLSDIAAEQSQVRWLLGTLATLSEHRLDGTWDATWYERTRPATGVSTSAEGTSDRSAADLASSWEGSVKLTGGVLAPYVAVAVERTFGIAYEERETTHGPRAVLVPWEWRDWHSILAPIALQLFDSLRRITEGEAGAGRCRECGEPFLMLDARRRLFCNERHRHRYNQRRRRRRLAQERSTSTGRTEAETRS